jgi:hypothetical protein
MDKITYFQSILFTIFVVISYVSYILFAFGISTNTQKYLNDLDYYVKIYVSLFLIWRFNMFRKINFNEFDKRIAFTSGIFIFTTTALNQILINYVDEIKKKIGLFFKPNNIEIIQAV